MELASMSIDKWMDKKLWYRYTMKYYAAIKNNVFVSVLIQWMNLNLFHFSSVTQSCPTLCNPMDCSTPGFPVLHHLPELAQIHVHQVGDATQPSHPLCSFLLPSIFPSIGVFSNESAHCVRWPKYWNFSTSPSNEYSGLMLKLKLQYFGHLMQSQLIGKDPGGRKDWRQEERETTEDELVGWHHRLNGHEFEQTPGDGKGQGSLVCCSPWGRKEAGTTELNNTEQ